MQQRDYTVEEKVRMVAEDAGIAYAFMDWATANVAIEQGQLPLMLYVQPASGTINVEDMQITDSPQCMLAVMDKCELDGDGKGNDNVIERCKAIAYKFIEHLNDSTLFAPIQGSVKYSVFYDRLDVNVCGVTFELTLRERQGYCTL